MDALAPEVPTIPVEACILDARRGVDSAQNLVTQIAEIVAKAAEHQRNAEGLLAQAKARLAQLEASFVALPRFVFAGGAEPTSEEVPAEFIDGFLQKYGEALRTRVFGGRL